MSKDVSPRIEGYWASDPDPKNDVYKGKYPIPKRNKKPWEGQQNFVKKLKIIEEYCAYKDWTDGAWGCSESHFDGCTLSDDDYIWKDEKKGGKKIWIWTIHLRPHYIEKYNVKVSPEFYQWAMTLEVPIVTEKEKRTKKRRKEVELLVSREENRILEEQREQYYKEMKEAQERLQEEEEKKNVHCLSNWTQEQVDEYIKCLKDRKKGRYKNIYRWGHCIKSETPRLDWTEEETKKLVDQTFQIDKRYKEQKRRIEEEHENKIQQKLKELYPPDKDE